MMGLEAAVDPHATFPDRLAMRVMQFGAVAIVLVVSTLHVFELDRFFVPKELVFHVTAVVAALLALRGLWRLDITRVDRALACYLVLSVLSALMATNRWLAFRALAISVSAVVIYRTARALRAASLSRPLLGALGLAIVLVAITSLLQTYGVRTDFFSENRSPGGTLGNRNFIAHVAAFGFPLLVFLTIGARSTRAYVWRAAGTALVLVALVLTRSRAAWLAFAVVGLVLIAAMLISRSLRRDARTWRRLAGIVLIGAAGVAVAIVLPNTLKWNDSNPYLESMRRVTDSQVGSGRGRLLQYEQSLLLAARHPLFGVGPGNWPVIYPARAPRHDPSLDQGDEGMTSNPWPSSDWVACIAERGLPAFVLLVLAVVGIARSGVRQLVRARDAEAGLAAMALLGTLAGACVTGAFDAVLLLALPAFLVWAALGALSSPEEQTTSARPLRPVWRVVLAAILVVPAIGVYRSAAQVEAMEIFAAHRDRASLMHAATIDPGNYRIQMRLAHMGSRGRCEHARAARALFPNAKAAAEVARGCGK